MYSKAFSRNYILRVIATPLLLFLLTGCGNSTSSTPTSISSPSSTPGGSKMTPLPYQDTPPLNQASLSTDVTHLHIESSDGFQCPWQGIGKYVGEAPNNLVLATNRLSYNQDELQQMRSYASSHYALGNVLHPNSTNLSYPEQPPATLRWVPGSSECGGVWDITNTGSATVQIPQVDVRLKKAPQLNEYRYHLLDVCTLTDPSGSSTTVGCATSIGNSSRCSPYIAVFHLKAGNAGDVFTATPTIAGCGELTLAPNATAEILFGFYISPGTPSNLIYSVIPEISLETATGQSTLPLQQLASILTFANPSQFTCYGLQGTTFVLENPIPRTGENPGYSHNCINYYLDLAPGEGS